MSQFPTGTGSGVLDRGFNELQVTAFDARDFKQGFQIPFETKFYHPGR